MKKIYLAFLIVVGSFIQSGNTQTASSGGGKLAGNLNELLTGESKPNELACVALAAWKERTDHENGFGMTNPESNVPKSAETVSQLDSITMQMAEAAITQMEEQAKIALQDSISKFMENYPTRNHSIMDALKASKRDTATFWDSSGAYLGQPAPNDTPEIFAPVLLAEKVGLAIQSVILLPSEQEYYLERQA
jgi:hypothetical protein